MADAKISALPASTTPLAGTEVLPVVQSGATKQVSVANLTAGRAVSASSLALTGSPLPVTSGGSGTATAFTAGSVVFAGASGTYSQSNTTFFWDSANNRLGIGNATPSSKVEVRSTNTVTDARGILAVNTTNAAAANLGGSISLGGENGQASTPYVFGSIAGRYEGAGYAGYLQLSTTRQSDGAISEKMRIDSKGNIYPTTGTTGMTDGFFYIPAAAGAPTGTPTAVSGRVPMYYDSTNNNFYIYNGGWKKVALA